MTDYYETRPSYRGDLAADENTMRRSMTRGSHQSQASVSASTISWVQQNHLHPPGPPPESSRFSPDLTPLRRPRPLPEPQLYQSRTAFQYVGTQEEEEDYATAEPYPAPQQQFMYHTEEARRGEDDMGVIPLPVSPIPGAPMTPPQGRAARSFVGGFFSGLKRLPKLVLKGGNEDKRRLKHKGTFNTETEGTSTTVTGTGMTRGNTLPRYLSNPSIGPSNPQFAHRLSMAVANGSLPPGSTPATVYHLRTNTAGPQYPIVTVTPASGSEGIAEEQAHFYDGSPGVDQPLSQHQEESEHDRHHLNDRATVMVYSTDSQVPTTTHSAALPPPRLPTPGPRVSYQTQLPTRDRANAQASTTEPLPSTGPGHATSHTGGILNTQQAMSTSRGDIVSSPRPTSSYTISAVPSFYDPSFASDLTPIEKFFKGLYNLPWVGQERVTIDYRPGDSNRAKAKVRALNKPMASWYRAVMSRSRRGSRNLDLLSSGTVSSPRTVTSFGNTLSPLGSPISRRSGRPAEGADGGYVHDHPSKPKRHRKKRHRATWTTTTTGGGDGGQYMPQRSTSPIVPTIYPYAYPGYPYAPYPTYGAYPAAPMPVPMHTAPRGPRKHRQKSKTHLNAQYQHGYAPYQPMAMPPPLPMNAMGTAGPPPLYFIAPSPPQSQTNGELANNNHSQTQTQAAAHGQGQGPMPAPMQVSPVIMHFVPGAFNPQNLNPHNPAMLSPPLTPQRQAGYGS
ncbi:hypothetical protein CVT25_005814 [Psilocybe cyanescens]|uniref:Uncharacterized protein n=1 Tax=Psilocybe cyanescens TaxID=93625 RepID=A0A409VV65_PSICY|nr:hypothetical protein CVT25_005814 [Psilocybe cyanescens]